MILSIFFRNSTIIRLLAGFILLINVSILKSQTIGDYQSNAATMNWSAAASWQTWNGTSWIAASSSPTAIASGQTVTILSGHTVTNNLTTVSNSGSIFITGTVLNSTGPLVNNSTGTITVNGTLTNNSTKIITNNGTLTNNGSLTNNGTINNNLTIVLNNNMNIASTGILNNAGTLNISSAKTLTNSGTINNSNIINNSGTLAQNNAFTNSAIATVNNTGTISVLAAKTLTNNGTINNSGSINNSGNITNPLSSSLILNSGIISRVVTTAVLSFASGSRYKHNFISSGTATGSIPIANWNAASNCEILACGDGSVLFNSTTFPTSTFGNFIWNNAAQSADINLNGRLNTITGSFTVQTTNNLKLILRTTTGNNTAVSGNMTINSGCEVVLTAGAGTFGTSNHTLTISGSLNITGGTLNLTSTSVAGGNGNGSVNLSGNLVHTAGSISKTGVTGGTFTFNGSALQTIESPGCTSGNNIIFNALQSGTAGALSVATGKTFIINPGTTFNVYANTTSSLNELTVNGTMKVSGTLNILNGAALDMSTTVLSDATSAGNFLLSDNATILTKNAQGISSSGATGCIQVSGTRTFDSDANYTYNGTTAQITGSGLPVVLTGKLKINNTLSPSIGGVTLTQSCVIDERSSSSLILTSGKLITSSTSLITLSDSSFASPAGGSSASFIHGPIKKIGFFSGTEFVFPTGDQDKWARIGFTSTTLSSTDAFTAQYFKENPKTAIDTMLNSTVVNRVLVNISQKEYWNLEPTSGTSIGKVKLYWEDATYSGISAPSAANLRVAHYYDPGAGLKWYGESNISPFVTVTSSGTTGTIQSFSNVNSFSPFTIGSVNGINPLPIELLDFYGMNSDKINKLTWTTASETNNDYFELQRSGNGIDFNRLAELDGHGNSTTNIEYAYNDFQPLGGINYYRLKQIDFDGKSSFSNIISIDNGFIEEGSVVAYPNPTNGNEITVNLSDNIISLTVYNLLGEVIYNSDIISENRISIGLNTKGVYLVKAVSKSNHVITSKIIKN